MNDEDKTSTFEKDLIYLLKEYQVESQKILRALTNCEMIDKFKKSRVWIEFIDNYDPLKKHWIKNDKSYLKSRKN